MPAANSRTTIQKRRHFAVTGLTALTAMIFGLPVLLGLIGILLPAFGYFPVLGKTGFSIDAACQFMATPGLGIASWLSLKTGLSATIIAMCSSFCIIAAFFSSRIMV